MNQHDLNQQIADITGESIATIKTLGFSLLFAPSPPFDRRRQMRQQVSAHRGKGASRTPSRSKRTKPGLRASHPYRLSDARQADIHPPVAAHPR